MDAVRRAEHSVISLHQPIGPEADTELGELLPDEAPSPYEQVEATK